jgi:hypothetical protein
VAIFDAINGFAVNASQLGKGGLAEVVFCAQSQKTICKLIAHVLHITLQRGFAWL